MNETVTKFQTDGKPQTLHALSIGPVFETLGLARKTIEIWAASYFFSYFAKLLLEEFIALSDAYEEQGKPKLTIFSPDVDDLREEINAKKAGEAIERLGVGRYSDRIYFLSADEVSIPIDTIKSKAIARLAPMVAKALQFDRAEDIADSLNSYLYVAYTHVSFPDGVFSVRRANDQLDCLELFQPFAARLKSGEDDYMDRFLTRSTLINSSMVRDEGFYQRLQEDGSSQRKLLPSLPHIAARSLFNETELEWLDSDLNEEDDLMDVIDRQYKQDRKLGKMPRYGRYVAVVVADGDNIGKTISKLSAEDSIRNISRKMLEYGKGAVKTVKKYGGFPVYFGGDDMIFFAPLCRQPPDPGSQKQEARGPQDLLSLLYTLDRDFSDATNALDPSYRFSLSFGMQVFYYKYPMNEALSSARDALFEGAKKVQWQEGSARHQNKEKKATKLRLVRHSGQTSELILPNEWLDSDSSIGKAVRSLLYPSGEREPMRSVHWKLIEQKEVVSLLLDLPEEEQASRLKAWFENNFNESIHRDQSDRMRKDEVISVLRAIQKEIAPAMEQGEQGRCVVNEHFWQMVDAIFRFGEFMIAKVDD